MRIYLYMHIYIYMNNIKERVWPCSFEIRRESNTHMYSLTFFFKHLHIFLFPNFTSRGYTVIILRTYRFQSRTKCACIDHRSKFWSIYIYIYLEWHLHCPMLFDCARDLRQHGSIIVYVARGTNFFSLMQKSVFLRHWITINIDNRYSLQTEYNTLCVFS